jgi:hypothetical protein
MTFQPILMLGDNMSMLLNTSVPSSVLKKMHNAIAYHGVWEPLVAKVMRFEYVKSKETLCDNLSKPFNNEGFHHLVKSWLFCVPEM